jgi:guanyl-specific ribonuclease Sa
LSLTALPNGANSYSWTGPNSFTSNIQNPTIVGAGVLASGVYSVNQTILGCTSPFGTTNVTVNPIPAAPTAASNSTICAGQNLSLTANPGGAVYAWSGPNSFTSNVQNPTIVGATTLASGTYSVTQTLLGCTSLPGATNVTVNPLPAAPTAANNSSICAGQTLSLTALPGGGIYFWTGPNSFTSNVQNPTIVGATILASGTYSVSQTLLGCTGPFGTTDVTVNPIPATPTAASNSTICAGQTLSLTANPGGVFSYNWTGPNSFTSNIQNPTIAGATT